MAHLGVGDFVCCLGLMRWLIASRKLDALYVAVKPANAANAETLSADLPQLVPVVAVTPAAFRAECARRGCTDVLLCGVYKGRRRFPELPYEFYDDAGAPRAAFWSGLGPVAVDPKIPLPDAPVAFVHNTASRGRIFSLDDPVIRRHLGKCFIVNPCENPYPRGHPRHEHAGRFVGLPLVQYIPVIQAARRIIVSNSAFFCLCIQVSPNADSTHYVASKSWGHIWKGAPASRAPFQWLRGVKLLRSR